MQKNDESSKKLRLKGEFIFQTLIMYLKMNFLRLAENARVAAEEAKLAEEKRLAEEEAARYFKLLFQIFLFFQTYFLIQLIQNS